VSLSSQTQLSPQRILATLQAYRDAAVLNTAIELELFTRIAHGNDTVNKLAAELGVPVRGIQLVCDSLAAAGLIIKDGEGLQLAPDAAMFLDKRSPSYLGGSAVKLYSTPLLRGFERLTEFVRGGKPGEPLTGEPVTSQPDWYDIARGVMDPAIAVGAFADAFHVPAGPLKILDAGAGNGAYGIAVASKYPEAIIVAADRPAELKIAQENAVGAKLKTRYQNIPGDLPAMTFGLGFDAAILAFRLNQLDPSQIELLMKRIRDALKKTGRLMILDFLSPDSPEYAAFGLTLLTATRRGSAYTVSEVKDMLRSSGFGSVDTQLLPPAHATLVTAQA
jgi:ubiquinone/menaquinone biosynthesis C-methylase UbiE